MRESQKYFLSERKQKVEHNRKSHIHASRAQARIQGHVYQGYSQCFRPEWDTLCIERPLRMFLDVFTENETYILPLMLLRMFSLGTRHIFCQTPVAPGRLLLNSILDEEKISWTYFLSGKRETCTSHSERNTFNLIPFHLVFSDASEPANECICYKLKSWKVES